MRFFADKLAILLSADWFVSAWPICGLRSPLNCRMRVRDRCRDLVRELLNGHSSYWEVEFSDRRGKETEAQLLDILAAAGLATEDLSLLRQAISEDAQLLEEDASLLLNLCSLLVSQYRRGEIATVPVGGESVRTIEEALSGFALEAELVTLAKSAHTDWDLWLQSLSTGLPMLQDTARDLFERVGPLNNFIAALRVRLNQEDYERLRAWLITTSISLTGESLNLPE